MLVSSTIDFRDFEPRSGAERVWERIESADKIYQLECILEDLYPDCEAISEDDLNDLLRFESDEVYHWLGMKTDDEIAEEQRERQERARLVTQLREVSSAEEFCEIWMNQLDLECTKCPLYREVDCNDDAALIASRAIINECVEELLCDLEEEYDDDEV